MKNKVGCILLFIITITIIIISIYLTYRYIRDINSVKDNCDPSIAPICVTDMELDYQFINLIKIKI